MTSSASAEPSASLSRQGSFGEKEKCTVGPILTVSVSALNQSGLSGRQLTTQVKSHSLCAATLGTVSSVKSRHWSCSQSSPSRAPLPGVPLGVRATVEGGEQDVTEAHAHGITRAVRCRCRGADDARCVPVRPRERRQGRHGDVGGHADVGHHRGDGRVAAGMAAAGRHGPARRRRDARNRRARRRRRRRPDGGRPAGAAVPAADRWERRAFRRRPWRQRCRGWSRGGAGPVGGPGTVPARRVVPEVLGSPAGAEDPGRRRGGGGRGG